MIQAVGFDLDDTLYDHAQYVRGAHREIAGEVQRLTGVEAGAFFERIHDDWRHRTSRCNTVFADALRHHGVHTPDLERRLVQIYREHRPRLEPRPGVVSGLRALRGRGLRLGLVTDGQPEVQRRKLQALGLREFFDVVVFTGELGPEKSKPHRAGFERLVEALGVEPPALAFVGDNPLTDFEAPKQMGMLTIRILAGEYRSLRSQEEPVDLEFNTVAEALVWLLGTQREA